MSDPLSWSPISLGRWFGTSVRIHITLIIFVAFRLLAAVIALAAKGDPSPIAQTACWLGLLLLALAVHELGHAVMAAWLDGEQGEVNVWPLGSLVGPSLTPRSSENFLVAMAGMVANGAIVVAIALGLHLFAGASFAWNPFGHDLIVNGIAIHHDAGIRGWSAGAWRYP